MTGLCLRPRSRPVEETTAENTTTGFPQRRIGSARGQHRFVKDGRRPERRESDGLIASPCEFRARGFPVPQFHPAMNLLPLPAQARVLALIVLTSSAAPPLGAQLPYQDGLDSAATAKIKPLVAPDMEGSFVDYSNFTVGAVTHAIPEGPGRMPNSAPTRGYLIRNLYSGDSRITNVLLADAPDGNPVVFSGNYRLKFDMYLSLDPSATRTSTGTTEVGLWGVGNDGVNAVGYFNRSTIATGVWGWLTVDGGIAANGDATIYDGITNLGRKQDTVDTTLFMSAFPTGAPIAGDANNQWTQVEITGLRRNGDRPLQRNHIL